MKAITIWQPWAEFIAAGVKHNETRSWATKYRGPIAIHAAVKPIRQVVPLLSEKAFGLMVEKLEKASMANGELLTYFNYGEVIATAELVACHLITEEYLSTLPDTEKALGDYSLGRYAWELRNVKELPEPIKQKASRGSGAGRHSMNITIKPWKPGDGGLICLPLRSNIPDASKHPDWRLVTCPSCGGSAGSQSLRVK